jgi:Trk-type K+ transport system membrane component
MAKVIQADRQRAAEILGYRDWDDATDYRQSGAAQREVHELAAALAAHREASTAQLLADMAGVLTDVHAYFANLSGMTVKDAQIVFDTVNAALSRIQGQGEYTCGGGE